MNFDPHLLECDGKPFLIEKYIVMDVMKASANLFSKSNEILDKVKILSDLHNYIGESLK